MSFFLLLPLSWEFPKTDTSIQNQHNINVPTFFLYKYMQTNLNWFVLFLSWTQESEFLWIKEKNLLSTYLDYQITSKTDKNVTQKLVGLVRVDQFWSFCVVFCNPLNVFPSFYDIVCLFFCNLRLLISPLVSSNFCYINHTNNSVSFPLITEYLPNLEWRYWTSISLVYYPCIHYLTTSK